MTLKKFQRYNTSVSSETERQLCEYLLSPYRHLSLKRYKKLRNVEFAEDSSKAVSNRKLHLEKLQKEDHEAFVAHCRTNGVSIPSTYAGTASESDSEMYESAEEIESPQQTLATATTTPSTPERTMTSTSKSLANEYGKKIIAPLPNGMIFVTMWTNVTLDENTLRFEISEDGKSVLMWTAKPEPNLEDLLKSFSFSNNRFHVVTAHLDHLLREMWRKWQKEEKWESEPIVKFDTPVIRSFVNENGEPTNEIFSNEDDDGRQRIIFFVKTVASMDNTPRPARFVVADEPSVASNHQQERMDELQRQMESVSFMLSNVMNHLQNGGAPPAGAAPAAGPVPNGAPTSMQQ